MRPALALAAMIAAASAALPHLSPAAETPPKVEIFLAEGRLAEGETALIAALKADPSDDQVRFGLGVLQFIRAVESRMQALNRFGYRTEMGMIGVSNLPIPINPKPQPLTYDAFRAFLKTWGDDLTRAEATLAAVRSDSVKLPLYLGRVRFDFDGDGKAGPGETLAQVYSQFNRQARFTSAESDAFAIAFDRGDVAWLRGYCHLLLTINEVALAHDGRDLFERTGHLFFGGAVSPYAFLNDGADQGEGQWRKIVDMVAVLHDLRLKPTEPDRMTAALKHLEAMIALSRESWKAYLAETDDDREWIPNPKQSTVMPNGKVTDEMVKGWMDFLDEAEALLAGKKLIPFWRGRAPLGVNLRRVFTEPSELDLVFWIQGTAAAPYLEKGDLTRPETWQRLQRIFRGEFIGFAIWFN